jgi:hypothetical protein
VFTARYALSPYTKHTRFVFKGFKYEAEQRQKTTFSANLFTGCRQKFLERHVKRETGKRQEFVGRSCEAYFNVTSNSISKDIRVSLLLLQFKFTKNVHVTFRICLPYTRQIFRHTLMMNLLTVRRLVTLTNKQTIVSKHCSKANGKVAPEERIF